VKPKRPPIQVDGTQFREWLEAMRTAQKRIEQEETARLRQLTPEQSLAIYHALWEAAAPHRDFEQPSIFILRLQRVFRRMREAQTRESAPPSRK
jgi:hypothetical protein